jgi:crossover junction endodeoxyribonuclease RuvC
VDPGGFVLGWGLVRKEGGRLAYEQGGVVRPRKTDVFSERLRQLHEGLTEIMGRLRPDAVAVEAVFHALHARSALQLGHARGVVLLAVAQAGLPVHEYPPATVKKAVTGHGAAEKEQVRKMVGMLLGTTIEGATDQADALAVAICHAHSGELLARLRAVDAAAGRESPARAKAALLRRLR